jgi:Ca2+-transporting ATPase
MMFQLYNVFNCRSTWRSAFSGLFTNWWLIGAVLLSLAAHVAVIYIPVLQTAFQTIALTPGDWFVSAGVGATLLAILEIAKVALRIERRSHISSQRASA